jgi:transposase
VKDVKDWAAVQKVYRQTKSKRKTAQILGISRNTVKRLLNLKEAPAYKRTNYPTKLDSYKEQIITWRCDPFQFNGTRIYRELQRIGYQGSISPLYRLLRRVDEDVGERISKKATVRHESPPGDQAQFDWSEYHVQIGDRYRKIYCFAMILSASRKKSVCFSLTVNADAIYDAIQELYEDFGGVTLELLIDNPKALVLENTPKSEDEIKYNPYALLLAKHLGTELNACPCYWPRKKGKIERPFAYIEEQFIKGSKFASMEELSRRGKEFVDKWCDTVHSTTKRIPNQHYLLEEERILQPLPKTHFYTGDLKKRIISPDSFISINGNKYSVPVKYAQKTMYYRFVYGYRIDLYDSKENFLMHFEASDQKHVVLSNPTHYEAIAPKVNTSIPQIRRDFTARYHNGTRYLEAAGQRFDQPTHYARKIMELGELYDDQVLDHLIGIAIEEDKLDMQSFYGLLKDVNSGIRQIPANIPIEASVTKTSTASPWTGRECSYYEFVTDKEAEHD